MMHCQYHLVSQNALIWFRVSIWQQIVYKWVIFVLYLRAKQYTPVWKKVKKDTSSSSRQSYCPEEQDYQKQVWESCCEIYHLKEEQSLFETHQKLIKVKYKQELGGVFTSSTFFKL